MYKYTPGILKDDLVLEVLYPHFGLYHRVTWKVWLTPALFLPYFAGIVYFWNEATRRGVNHPNIKLVYRIFLAVWGVLVYRTVVVGILNLITYEVHILPKQIQNEMLGLVFMDGVLITLLTYWVLSASRKRQLERIAITALVVFVHAYGLEQFGLISHSPAWTPVWTTVTRTVWISILTLMDRWVSLSQTSQQ